MTGAVSTLTAGLAFGAFAPSGTADGATDAAAAAGGPRVKPTAALEHGAFADGSSWNGVIADLRADPAPPRADLPAPPYGLRQVAAAEYRHRARYWARSPDGAGTRRRPPVVPVPGIVVSD
ncbi:hypothetical protein [Streptomyces mexicanus]|uniref:hypothetical protein n=1 Tax=Streptomyces mexicanus TaxID=178566 RepID=UPI00368B9B25